MSRTGNARSDLSADGPQRASSTAFSKQFGRQQPTRIDHCCHWRCSRPMRYSEVARERKNLRNLSKMGDKEQCEHSTDETALLVLERLFFVLGYEHRFNE